MKLDVSNDQNQDETIMKERVARKIEVKSEDKKNSKDPIFNVNLLKDSKKGLYVDQVAPKLSKMLGEEGKDLTKSTIDFLTGRHEFGSFSKGLSNAVNELKEKGFEGDRVVQLVERTYGELSKNYRKINDLPEN